MSGNFFQINGSLDILTLGSFTIPKNCSSLLLLLKREGLKIEKITRTVLEIII